MNRRHQAGVLAGALAAALLCAGPAGAETAPSVHPRNAAQAAARLRALYFSRDFVGGTLEGARLVVRFPDSDEVRAWYLMNRVRPWHSDERLVRDAEAMVAVRPDSPWALFALAGVLNWSNVRSAEALDASERVLEAMPGDADALWLRVMTVAMHDKPRRAVRLARRSLTVVPEPANLLNAIGMAHYRMARGEFSLDEDVMARAFSAFEEARRADPKSVNAHFLHGQYLVYLKRNAEAYPLLKQAIALAPLSIDMRPSFWQAVMGLTERPATANAAEIETDIRRLRAARGRSPETLLAITRQYDEMGLEGKKREVQDRLLAVAPDSPEAEWVIIERARDLARAIHEDGATADPRDRKAYARLLRDFVRRPRHHHEGILGEAYADLFREVRDDPGVGPDELLDLARKMLKHETINVPYNSYKAPVRQ